MYLLGINIARPVTLYLSCLANTILFKSYLSALTFRILVCFRFVTLLKVHANNSCYFYNYSTKCSRGSVGVIISGPLDRNQVSFVILEAARVGRLEAEADFASARTFHPLWLAPMQLKRLHSICKFTYVLLLTFY